MGQSHHDWPRHLCSQTVVVFLSAMASLVKLHECATTTNNLVTHSSSLVSPFWTYAVSSRTDILYCSRQLKRPSLRQAHSLPNHKQDSWASRTAAAFVVRRVGDDASTSCRLVDIGTTQRWDMDHPTGRCIASTKSQFQDYYIDS